MHHQQNVNIRCFAITLHWKEYGEYVLKALGYSRMSIYAWRRKNQKSGMVVLIAKNILKIPLSRDEPMSQPEKMQLLTQITEFAFLEDKILHTAITNCFDGMIVDWALGYHASSDLINTMLDAVNANASNGCHSPVRSDRGCHYGWRK